MLPKDRDFLPLLSFVIAAGSFFLAREGIVVGFPSTNPKPDPKEAVGSARWLVSKNSWSVLNTIADDLGGAPLGNVVFINDGPPNESTCVPYFYLMTLDPTAHYALKDERASFTVSEYPVGTCRKEMLRTQLARRSLLRESQLLGAHIVSFQLKVLDENSEETNFGLKALFSNHPEMKDWPKNHGFRVFKLDIENIFLIDWFGGPKPITLDQCLRPNRNALELAQ